MPRRVKPRLSLGATDVAALLQEFSQRSLLAGGNPHRVRAYAKAAESLRATTEPLSDLIARKKLQDIPGVGDSIADIIAKLHRTGTHPTLEEMRRDLPAGVLDLLAIPGLRPDKVIRLHRELGINSLADLEQAAREDRLSSVKGLGPTLQRKILEGLEVRSNAAGSRHLHRAAEFLGRAEANLKRSKLGLTRIVAAGDYRRCSELVSDLALVAEASSLGGGSKTLTNGELSIHLTDAEHYGATLLHATGSRGHLDQLRELAAAKGLSLEPEGLLKHGKLIAAKTEAAIHKALGLKFIEPELREGLDEIERAKGRRRRPLVAAEDIRGILHAHTNASDGVDTLAEMAEATRQRGYSYFGVADHSKSAFYAGGLSIEEIDRQHVEIDRLNRKLGRSFRIFKGIESDILSDGSLDYPDEVLARFDFVVASVHGQFRKRRDEQTGRILRAVRNPRTTILGHMTGRQLLRRPGYDIDVEKILAACAKHDVAVEINANPWRLDLDWRWHAKALELGCTFSINPDAHSTAELDLIRWGIGMARKGGIPPGRVLNCLDLAAFTNCLQRRRSAKRGAGNAA